MATTNGSVIVGVHILLTQILQLLQPTDILLHTTTTTDQSFLNVVDAFHQTVGSDQIRPLIQTFQIGKQFKTATSLPTVSSHRYRLLIVLLQPIVDIPIGVLLIDLNERVPDYFVHTTLILMPDCQRDTISTQGGDCDHISAINRGSLRVQFPFVDNSAAAIVITATIDSQPQQSNNASMVAVKMPSITSVHHVTQNMVNWSSTMDMSLLGILRTFNWSANGISYTQRIAVVRDRMPIHLDRMQFLIYTRKRAFSASGKITTPGMMDALDRHFGTCVVSDEDNVTAVSRRCASNVSIDRLKTAYFNILFGLKPTMRTLRFTVPISQNVFILLAPNWWTPRVHTIDRKVMFFYIATSVVMLLVFIFLRGIDRIRRFEHFCFLLIDTFGRMLCIGQPDERGRNRFVNWIGVIASIWGLLNSGTMTGALFGWTLNIGQEEVFGTYDDVVQHKWIPIVAGDWVMLQEMYMNERYVVDVFLILELYCHSCSFRFTLPIYRKRMETNFSKYDNSTRKSFVAYLVPASSTYKSTELLNMEHENNHSAVFRSIKDLRCERILSENSFILSYCSPLNSIVCRVNGNGISVFDPSDDSVQTTHDRVWHSRTH